MSWQVGGSHVPAPTKEQLAGGGVPKGPCVREALRA